MPALPSGTVTFLFADLEGSTGRLEQDALGAGQLLASLLETIRRVVEGHRGSVFETVGDAAYAAFARPTDAIAAAAEIHPALATGLSTPADPPKVRVAIHTGEVESRGRHYFGAPLFRCARLMSLGWGGQTLVSSVTAGLVRAALPKDHRLVDRGSHALKDLTDPEQVHELVGPATPLFPPLRSGDVKRGNLPEQLPSLVGREADISAVTDLLERSRLVTITGTGGTGKTSVALAVAARASGIAPGGAWFVDLAPLRDPDAVASVVASAVGVQEQPPTPIVETLANRFGGQPELLVLDNFEQVTAAAPIVARLLGAPGLRVIATSREPLRLREEREYGLQPLTVAPDPGSASLDEIAEAPSVQLFVERVREVLPSFELTGSNAAAVAGICRRLDGLPLAIELAAALVRVLTPEQLLRRLDARLDLLTARNRDLPERQRTLRAALSWSYDLLAPEERRGFEGLSVFAGSLTLEAAERVLADLGLDVVGLVGSLLDKSLLIRDFETSAETRFRMLDTVRAFATERLAAAEDDAARHSALAAWTVDLLERDGQAARWVALMPDLDAIGMERENIRAALEWQRSADPPEAFVRLVAAASSYWLAAGFLTESRPWLEAAIRTDSRPSMSLARLLRNAASTEHQLGATGKAVELGKASVSAWEAVGDETERADALRVLGSFHLDRGDVATAVTLLTEAEVLAAAGNDTGTRRACLADLGNIALGQGETERADQLFHELLELCAREGDRFGTGIAHGDLAYSSRLRGDLVEAERHAREAVAVFSDVEKRDFLGWSLINLGGVLLARGVLGEAEATTRRGLALTWESGVVRDVAAALDTVAEVALAMDDPRRAVRAASAATRIRRGSQLVLDETEARLREEVEAGIRAALGAAYAAEAEAAAAQPIESIVAEELSETAAV
jgi:predicted ATPase